MDGEKHFFRTKQFPLQDVPRPEERPQGPVIHRTNHIPAWSANAELFPPRKIKIDLGNGEVYKPDGKFATTHISVLPLKEPLIDHDARYRDTVYHPFPVWFVHLGPGPARGGIRPVHWSSVPNWEEEGRKRDQLKKLLPKKLVGWSPKQGGR